MMPGKLDRPDTKCEHVGKRFEDLHVALWIVAADLVLQREFVFEQGDLGAALDATSDPGGVPSGVDRGSAVWSMAGW